MDKFEKLIKDSVQGYEAPYNPDAWKSLNKKLGPSKGTITKWIVGSAAVITVLAVSYRYTQTNELTTTNPNTTIVNDNTTPNTITNKIDLDTDLNETDVNLNTHSNSTDNTNLNANTPQDNSVINNNSTDVDGNDFEVKAQPNVDVNDKNLTDKDGGSDNGITYSTTKTVNYKAGVDVRKSTVCFGESVTITPTVPKQKVIYEWDLGDGTIKTGGVIKHKYNSAGTYSVQLTLKDLKTNKIVKQSETVDITVLSVPQTSFVYENTNGIVPETNFRNETQRIKSMQWEIVGLYASTRDEFNYSFKQKGDFVVKLTTTHENGCSNTATKVITIEKDYNLLAPTAFTPNNDYLNDEFMPKALPLLNLPFTMTIYDRQGKLVYQTTDANQPWDGLYTKDGVPAPNGVYIWVVQLTNENGEIEMYQDQVTITR